MPARATASTLGRGSWRAAWGGGTRYLATLHSVPAVTSSSVRGGVARAGTTLRWATGACGLAALARAGPLAPTAARTEAAATRGLASASGGAGGSGAQLLPAGVSEITLYQYEICPYCCKVKAYLDWARISYRVVEINPVAKKEMAALTEYNGGEPVKKVPAVLVGREDGSHQLLRESSDIIDSLIQAGCAAPAQVEPSAELSRWRKWVDEHWVRVVTVNIYRTVAESLQTFEYMTSLGKFSAFEQFYVRYGGGMLMYAVAKGMRKKYGIADGAGENGTEPRKPLLQAADEWCAAVDGGEGRHFLGVRDEGGVPRLSPQRLPPVCPAWGVAGCCEAALFGPWHCRSHPTAALPWLLLTVGANPCLPACLPTCHLPQGASPSVADLEVFGVELRDQRPALDAWYTRMAERVHSSRLPADDGSPYVDPRADAP
jgi:glutathione S-transferase